MSYYPGVYRRVAGKQGRIPNNYRSKNMSAEEIQQERARSGWNQYAGEEEVTEPVRQMRPEEPGNSMNSVRTEEPGNSMNSMRTEEPGNSMNSMRTEEPGNSMNSMRTEEPGNSMNNMRTEEPMESMDSMWKESSADQLMTERNMVPMEPTVSMNPPWSNPNESWETSGCMCPGYMQDMEDQKMLERDLQRLQSMYPQSARTLLPYVEEECDKMEYEGSMMFDEHPDLETVRSIVTSIMERVQEAEEMQKEMDQEENPAAVMFMQRSGGPGRPGRPGRPHQGNFLEDLIRVMLLQEMHQRRCRHRNCRRWIR